MTEHKQARHSARMPQTLTHKQMALLPEIGRYSPLARHACDIANVLLSTGMLVAQLALLCWRDVDFDEYMISSAGQRGALGEDVALRQGSTAGVARTGVLTRCTGTRAERGRNSGRGGTAASAGLRSV